MSVDLSEFHEVFFDESHEHLAEMEQQLLDLDLDQPDPEALNSIFRAAHSIKGGSGIFGFDALGKLTHVMETILDLARNQQMDLDVAIVDVLLETNDQLKDILSAYQNNNDIDWDAIEEGTKKLEAILPEASSKVDDEEGAFGFFGEREEKQSAPSDNDAFGFFDEEDVVSNTDTDDGFGFFDEEPEAITADANNEEGEGFGFFDEEVKASMHPDSEAEVPKTPPPKKPVPAAAPKRTVSTKSENTTIRVDTTKIDSLVNQVGELVITQSMLRMIGSEVEGTIAEKIDGALDELSQNIRQLQESIMSMRMLPISSVFNRFPRVVRDLANKLDKSIDLDIRGGDTEIDKGMIEKLVDPLTHLVRNSVDHGVESKESRRQSGKSETGTITLSAEQLGGNVVIKIIDDGGGLDRERILEKARSNGLQVNDDATDGEIWQLIFEPGFSTAAAVTDVSGRGVGMDVVRRNIESINGSIEIQSKKGEGTTIFIRLPLTLAILDGMCVTVEDQTYIIPLTHIVESIQPDIAQIKTLSKQRMLWVREEYWPLISLSERMELNIELEATHHIVVLVESSRARFGLLVERLEGQQQVVIKSLERHYRSVEHVAGATILGDGSVALILDLDSIATAVDMTLIPERDHERA
ncbi:chemotaxis protein CheA [Alteromonas sp. ASW11-130]|uniref:chemotaxis protein CheA n=1 Tax=Alteromonas sp. ASW11-130 TaxID=3015775 RepID=UPI002241B298|nr:chemotaxis protein CheA [Alteromonas sp. ASW11-130]MCW8092990.1 chemotaxis protein CheA [Alteromonas sp. ASW11-130]